MKNKNYLATATLLAALAIVLGAFGAHGLKQILPIEKVDSFKTGVQYQFYHAIAIALAVLISQHIDNEWIKRSMWFFIGGIICFSGSLYFFTYLAVINTEGGKGLGLVTPLGGVFFLIGWLLLTLGLMKNKSM